jgi:hypothetical protein
VHHPAHPAPSPPDAGRDTVPSRFGRQSGDCGYLVRGHLTARYRAAVPRRILLMEQQVWSRQLARQSTLRPRVAVPSPHDAFQEHAAHPPEWSGELSSNGSSGTCIPDGGSSPHSYAVIARRGQLSTETWAQRKHKADLPRIATRCFPWPHCRQRYSR